MVNRPLTKLRHVLMPHTTAIRLKMLTTYHVTKRNGGSGASKIPQLHTGGPHKRRVWLFVRNVRNVWNIRNINMETGVLLITNSNSQRKTHQIVQIRHLAPLIRQYTTTEVGLHLLRPLT